MPPCDQQAAIDLPPREDAVVHTDHWLVAHPFNSTLPGSSCYRPGMPPRFISGYPVDAAG